MDLLEKRSLNNFDRDALRLLGHFELQSGRAKINGSAQYKHLLYRSDYDVMTVIPRTTPSEQLFTELSGVLRKVEQDGSSYFIELKLETTGGEKYRTHPGESLAQETLTRHYEALAFIKLDVVLRVKNRFYEASCIYRFQADAAMTLQAVQADLAADAAEFLRAKNYYKALKRRYSLAVLGNHRAEIEALTRVFNSELGKQYERLCNLKAMALVREHYKDKTTESRLRTNLRLLGETFQLRSLGREIARAGRQLAAEAKPVYQELYGKTQGLRGGAKKKPPAPLPPPPPDTHGEDLNEEQRRKYIAQAIAELGPDDVNNAKIILRKARHLLVNDLSDAQAYETKDETNARARAAITADHVQEYLKAHEVPQEEEQKFGKEKIIAAAFNDYINFGNVARTLADAKKQDKSITRKDVQDYKDKYYVPLKNHRGVNSYVADKPRREYQIDLMFFDDLREKDKRTKAKVKEKYAGALLVVDIFTKFCHVEPIVDKTDISIEKALRTSMQAMGGKPEMVYHDAEPAFTSEKLRRFFVKNDIYSITTLGHAPVAERTIRTVKGLLYPRVKEHGTKWWDELPKVMLIYNNVDKHRSTGFTPNDAKLEGNHKAVKLELELNRRRERKYPPLAPGDKIRVFKKKEKGEKENVAPWTKETWKVSKEETTKKGRLKGLTVVHVQDGQPPLPAKKHWLLRHEVLKVPN